MQCRVGDLAVIVRADTDPECLGRIVRVVALRIAMGELAWQVDPPHFWTCRDGLRLEVMWDDRDLKPLRDGDGTDEMLLIAGAPAGAVQVV
ncbi:MULTISPECIES: hypothetical protein [unclassified Simplicispira]|uniref:hypothetical protein n=1 Tax=unclassified Simplicispira TaxID=2630407 RepID=UPI000D5E41F6|nr:MULTISPECIES: hypothetical protein [unclassified Simplicispira]PVY56778.1 hypothetical protein C8D04_2043 [Simplicispira sp. 125]REG17723.1 hypothetical protein C8D01_2353 [Simplicispira sp. 110]